MRRRRQARRISLSVSRIDGRAQLTAPLGCRDTELRRFLNAHLDWLTAALARAPDPIYFADGLEMPVRGATIRLAHAPGRRGARLSEGVLTVGGRPSDLAPRALAWLREAARADLAERAHAHAATLGARVARLSIRDTRSRWGSCSSTGALSFSWRLILAPSAVLDYVAAHEAAHLLEMNHSQRFWAHVARLRPDWRAQRAWLHRNGADLHRYQAPPQL